MESCGGLKSRPAQFVSYSVPPSEQSLNAQPIRLMVLFVEPVPPIVVVEPVLESEAVKVELSTWC